MNRFSLKSRSLASLTVAATLALSGFAFAQQGGKAKDDALDDLLKKVEDVAKKDAAPKPAEAKAKPKPGDVAPKDKDLDSLLDKLGQSDDKASPDGAKPPPPPGGGADDKDKDKQDMKPSDGKDKKPGQDQAKSKPKDLTGKDKETDEVLDELMGKKKKPKPGEGQAKKGQKKPGDEGDGPLGDLVKQMREVEERLGKPDTGEQTRQKQTEIVKKMDTMIEQMKKMQTQKQAMRAMRQGQQKGQQQQGDQTGAQAQGVGMQKPEKPKTKAALALDKNPWGHLPPELRAEMDNIFKEDLLPAKQDLIKRYYLSVSKKALAREE